MAAVKVTIDGQLYDLWNKTTQRVVLMGDASLTGLEVGGGPIIPPPGGGTPPSGPPNLPIHPIWGPPGFVPIGPGMPPGVWGGPIIPPPNPIMPAPPAGSVVIPPWNQPVQPIVAPDFVWVNYPGYGWVMVGKPVSAPVVPPGS